MYVVWLYLQSQSSNSSYLCTYWCHSSLISLALNLLFLFLPQQNAPIFFVLSNINNKLLFLALMVFRIKQQIKIVRNTQSCVFCILFTPTVICEWLSFIPASYSEFLLDSALSCSTGVCPLSKGCTGSILVFSDKHLYIFITAFIYDVLLVWNFAPFYPNPMSQLIFLSFKKPFCLVHTDHSHLWTLSI